MTRRIENQVGTQPALEEDPSRVDGDPLGLFILERIEQEGILERLGIELALRPDLLQLAFRERVGIGQQPADHRALPMVDVADDHDVHPRRTGGSSHGALERHH